MKPFLSRLNIGYFKTVPGIIKLIEVVSKENILHVFWFEDDFWIIHSSRIFKLLGSLRIDSKEPIPPRCVALLPGTTTLFLLGS